MRQHVPQASRLRPGFQVELLKATRTTLAHPDGVAYDFALLDAFKCSRPRPTSCPFVSVKIAARSLLTCCLEHSGYSQSLLQSPEDPSSSDCTAPSNGSDALNGAAITLIAISSPRPALILLLLLPLSSLL